jgi:tRNA(adenine34) deaminase
MQSDTTDKSSADLIWMAEALIEADKAKQIGEVPVGVVVVANGQVVGRGHNHKEHEHDPTAHAEIRALRHAAHTLQRWRLTDCTVYVTLEPCAMCAGAMLNARIARLVFGCYDPKAGCCGSLYQLHADERFNHRFLVTAGVYSEQSAELLRDFFRQRRSDMRRSAHK